MKIIPYQYFLKDDGVFPNNNFPVVHYKKVIGNPVPKWLSCAYFKFIFFENDWLNNLKTGIATFHHYHSNTHKVLGVCSGKIMLLLGGESGLQITIEKGDVLIIPAGVAHKNLGNENDVICVEGYADGITQDIRYGRLHERPVADISIALAPFPVTDPLLGEGAGLVKVWKKIEALGRIKFLQAVKINVG